jgi:hypothetical protein
MPWRESDGVRRYFLTIENYHPGPEDTTRTSFIVRGETAAEVLENIIDNTQPTFGLRPDNFRKGAFLFYRTADSCARQPLTGDMQVPQEVEQLYLRFRPWAERSGTERSCASAE